MTARVELTTRTTRSESKPTRSYITPLSDASNKSSDSSISSSLIIAEDTRGSSKPSSMFGTGLKPRLSPKPFTRERPESKSVGVISTLLIDEEPQSDVPFQTSTSIALFGSTKTEEPERVGRRIITSKYPLNFEEDQGNKSDLFSPVILRDKKSRSSFVPASESKSALLDDESKVTSKPPIMSRRADVSQEQEKIVGSFRRPSADTADKQKGSLDNVKHNTSHLDAMDSLKVRDQLRPKRRPVSALFLDSENDQTSDNKVTEQRTWNRRPLSEDLTSLFESRGLGNKKESPSEEFKENRPLRKKSFSSNITEEQSDAVTKAGEFTQSARNETGTDGIGISSRNMFSARGTKDTTERKSSRDLGIPMEASSTVNRPTNSINTVSKTPDHDDSPTRAVKNANGSGTSPVTMRQRLNLYLANTSSSVDLADPPSSKEAKTAPSIERTTRGNVSDMDMEFGRPRTASQSQAADVKKFPTSSNVEPRLEKTLDEKSVPVTQDYGIQKEQKTWQSSEFSEERPLRLRKSFRKVDGPYQLENNENGLKEKKSYGYSDKTEDSENMYKKPAHFDNSFKTVKATMFENKIERHSPPELLSTGTSTPSQPTKSEQFCESPDVKHDTESWSKWLSDDSVHVVTQLHKNSEDSDSRFNGSRIRQASSSSTDHTNALQNKVDEKTRVEPRYEVISSSVGERVSSESIKMVPESKAMTLRSQRSFRRREPEETVVESRNLNRPVSNLQRSKSEIRKKVTPESSQESPTDKRFSRDLDFPIIRKYGLRTEKNESPKTPEDGTYEIGKNKSSEASDFQRKPYKSDYTRKKESALQQDSTELPPFEASISDGKDIKSFDNSTPDSRRSFRGLVVRGSETGPKSGVKDVSSNFRDEIIKSKVEEINKPSYQWNRFSSDKDSPRSKKENKDDSNELIGKMLNEDVEKMKRDLFVNQPTKEVSVFSTEKQVKEEYTEELRWERMRPPLRDRNANTHSTGNASDLFKSEFEDSSKKQNISNLKDAFTTDSKVTYFAVTGMDNKKEKNENNFENQSNDASMWSSDEFYFSRNMRTSTTHSALDSNSNKPEGTITHGDLEISSTPKELKTYRNQRVLKDIYGSDSVKPSENPSDGNNFKPRQKSGLDDIIPSYKDLHPKLEQEVNEPPWNTTLDSPIKLDRAYKSKAVDIDSLMAEYRAGQQKESMSKDGDRDVPKWETSSIFRENTSEGYSSKWKDPPVKHVSTIESYQSESIMWSSSQDNSSIIESPKQNPHKTSNTGDHMYSLAKYDKYPDKKKEGGFQVLSETSQNIATLDSLLESSKKHSYFKGRSIQTTESLTVTDKVTVTETSVNEPLENSAAVKFSSKSSVKTDRKFVSSEERPPPTVKNADMLSRMLENREKRAEQRRARHNLLVEETQEPRTQRIKSQQESYHSETKEYFEREDYKSPAKQSQEQDVLAAMISRKSLRRHRERDFHSEEDHIKQCFSRSPTSNKDTDSLVQDPDRQYGTWSPTKQQTEDSCVTESPSYDNSSRKQHSHSRLSSLSHTETDQHDSITEARDGSLDRCSMDLDSTDGTESTPSEAKAADFSFIDQTSVSVLDSTALKNRVQLNRKSQRRAPSQSQRRSRVLQPSSQLAVIEDTDNPWMYTDTTEEKNEQKEEVEIEEEKPKRSSVHSPRMPVFPGMDHSSLMAQLRKKQDAESSSESLAQPTKSPKSPLPHGTIGIKLLPTSADKQDKGTGESPQWMKDLKSKKRQSQYENSS
ncbi:uncharacterized protein KIAA1671 homolog [Hyperolius riggenbachi]|uniref:uncharacterized protein KIAA1671 homolog n=1 Tax=Hyperolius riggenbachi TaxID=752182 RepID=UPI0035A3403B